MTTSPRQIQILGVLAASRDGSLGSRALAERLRLTGPQITVTLNALLGHGAVTVVPAGREVVVTITPQGRRIHARGAGEASPS